MGVLSFFLARFGLIFAFFMLIFCGCSPRRQEPRVQGVALDRMRGSEGVFAYRDSFYDDRGSGRYIYPVALQDRNGLFDLREFQIRDLGRMLEIRISFRALILRQDLSASLSLDDFSSQAESGSLTQGDLNKILTVKEREGRSLPADFFHQMIDIYIDTDHLPDSGRTFALPGRNIEFNANEGWEKVIVIHPGSRRLIDAVATERSEWHELYKARSDILVPSDIKLRQYQIIARVPRRDFPATPVQQWGFQVCVMGYEPSNLARNGLFNREVTAFATDTTFGGGSDYEGNPNVIDILSPDKDSQFAVLSRFRSGPYAGEHVLAILPMIYGTSVP